MRVELLNAARVVLDDEVIVRLRPTMRDRALAYLAYSRNWVQRDRLAFLFWPDTPDATARHNVRQLLKRIRRLHWLLDLEVEDENVRWPVRTDVDDLRRSIADSRWERVPTACELLPGFERGASVEFEGWLMDERMRVHDEWRSAVLAADAADDAGEPKRGASLLEPVAR